MHNLKEIRKDFDKFKKSLEKRSIEINFDNNNLSDQQTEKLVAVAKGCPVAQSLRSDLIQEIKFNF